MSTFTGRSSLTDDRMSREAEKERLRKQIVSTRNNAGEGKKKPSLLVYIAAILALSAVIYGACYQISYAGKSSFSVIWEKNTASDTADAETFRGYALFKGGIIRYSKDGAEFTDKNGNVVWERSYQLNSPIIDVSSEYAVIADQGSTGMFIFNGSEATGITETILPISLVSIADNGVVYAVLNDSDAEYITALRADGSAIDLSVKSVINGDGYPFAIDVSPDGTQLVTSYVSIADGKAVNEVVFRNFGPVGQNEDARRVVGGFRDEFSGHLAGRVNFSTNEYSQAFYDGGIVFFTTKVLNSPSVLANVSFDKRMLAAACGSEMSAVLLDNMRSEEAAGSTLEETAKESSGDEEIKKTQIATDDSTAPYHLIMFNNKGVKTGEADVDIGYKDICIGNGCVIVYGTHEIRVYGIKGNLRGSFSYEDGEISSITADTDSNILYLAEGNSLKQLKY